MLRKGISQDQGQIVGFFDKIQIISGRMYIDGWIDAPGIRLSTEIESLELVPDISRADVGPDSPVCGFSVSLKGARTLSYQIAGSSEIISVSLQNFVASATNLVRTGMSLLHFPIYHGRDLISYFLHKDERAGERLERALLPLEWDETIPVSNFGLFGNSQLPELVDPVDILIPVFNAANEVVRCLEQIDQHTAKIHNITIIDDASTDPLIGPILDNWCDLRPNVRLIRNQQNLGFVDSINQGLENASGHVVILNSDAFVPENWLNRLMAPIQTDNQVASVTPMSNNAEIFTTPVVSVGGEISKSKSIQIDQVAQKLDWQVANCSAPTGVGFCMGLSRTWLEKVPRFDTSFAPGYGEEVDWCQKVALKGAKHVGLGSLFVEHTGGISFGAAKPRLMRKSNALINTRYPNFDTSVASFEVNDPLVGPRLALALAAIDSGKPVPFYLAHRLGGGAELWLGEEIAFHLKNDQGVAVLREDDQKDRAVLEIHSSLGVTRGIISKKDLSGFLAIPTQLHMVYSCLVARGDPSETIRICKGALDQLDQLTMVFHDYLPLCPSYNLIGANGKYCGLPEAEKCGSCFEKISKQFKSDFTSIEQWRNTWKELLARSDKLITFSEDSRLHVKSVWPEFGNKIIVQPHTASVLIRRVQLPKSDVVTVGILGGIGYHKGAGVLKKLAQHTDHGFRVVVIGDMDSTYSHERITVHGEYDRSEIADLAKSYSLTCWFLPSIWPETFCYTLRECLSTGLKVFGFDIGAQADALQQHKNGQVIPLDANSQMIKSILSNSQI